MEARKQNWCKISLVKRKKNLILYVERVGDIVVSLQQDTLAYNNDYPKTLACTIGVFISCLSGG